jgi:hypothetical protein
LPTVGELSDPYANFMRNPLPPDHADVCSVCLTFTDGFERCVACSRERHFADAVLPISYSVHFGQLHTALGGYKRDIRPDVARRFTLELAAVLWRFLGNHEACLAARVGADAFGLVTAVPSSSAERDESHPLHDILGALVQPTAPRYARALARSDVDVPPRVVDARRFIVTREVQDADVLLVDDTWTTGANVESAAGALKSSGARSVGVVIIGRHLHEEWGQNAERLRALPRGFDWDSCAFEADP